MRLPSLRKHKTGQGFVTILGHDYYCGVFGKPETQAKYELLLAEYLANRHSFAAVKSANVPTVQEITLAYLEYANETYDSREFNNIKLMSRAVLKHYGELPADAFGPTQFKTVRSTIQTEGDNRSRQYINKCMRLLLRMIKWCTGEGLIDPNVIGVVREIDPLKKGRTNAPESKKVDEVSQAAVNATLLHLPAVVADMVRLQQLLGCRPGELCVIKPNMLNRSGAVWVVDFEQHKTAHRGQTREVYVGPKAQSILAPYLDRAPNRFCFSPSEAVAQRRATKAAARTTPPTQGNRAGYNSTTRSTGTPASIEFSDAYNTGSYGHAIKYACKQAWPAPDGSTKSQANQWHAAHAWSPNQLRHSAASEIREAFGLEHCAAVLGHADIDTSKIYASLRRTKAIEAAATR